MNGTLSLALLDKQILELRGQLEREIGQDINKLSSPEVLAINQQIDELVVLYIKLTQRASLE